MDARALVLALALVTVSLTGCIGPGEDDQPVQKQRAEVTDTTGGIDGVVTDTAVNALVEVNVTLRELGESTTTAEDGSFAFSRIEPGTYTLVAQTEGFVPAEETIEVVAGQTSTVDLMLSHLTSDEPYIQNLELVGFIECGVGWATPLPIPFGTASLAACAVPQIAADNSTNDKFLHRFDLEPPVETVVYELTWESESSALLTIMEVEGFWNDRDARLYADGGQPPLYERIERPIFENISQNFTDNCEGANGTEADDDYCGYNFWDRGWPLAMRVFAHWDCNEVPARACPILQEEFTHYISAFYNGPAPVDYAIIEGNGPES